jgi:hypothetical protein
MVSAGSLGSGGWVDEFEGQQGAAASDLTHIAGQSVTVQNPV